MQRCVDEKSEKYVFGYFNYQLQNNFECFSLNGTPSYIPKETEGVRGQMKAVSSTCKTFSPLDNTASYTAMESGEVRE